MKLIEDPNARARLRMLRVWVSADQYRDICLGLSEVDAPQRGALRRQLASRIREACKRVVSHARPAAGWPPRPAGAGPVQ